jgi:hypothetical protein
MDSIKTDKPKGSWWLKWLRRSEAETESSYTRRPLSWVEGGCVLTPQNYYEVLGLPKPKHRLIPLRVKVLLYALYVLGLIVFVNFREPILRFWDPVLRLFAK